MSVPHMISEDALNEPVVIPAMELRGTQVEQLRALDVFIARLQQLRRAISGDSPAQVPPSELHGPYLHAPVWPWFFAGWVIGALFVLMFVAARLLWA